MTDQRHDAATTLDRIQQNFLARSERQLLTWLCAHMPRQVTPDLLTLLGLIGALMTFIGYTASNVG
ncbi:MAG: CDP-alcohol phosphatidyltransferase family protein, partial [Sphingobium yanoikuyae]